MLKRELKLQLVIIRCKNENDQLNNSLNQKIISMGNQNQLDSVKLKQNLKKNCSFFLTTKKLNCHLNNFLYDRIFFS